MNRRSHWENVYTTKGHDQVSWFREHLDTSLRMIVGTGVEKDAAIIDIGGGASTLVDDLLITDLLMCPCSIFLQPRSQPVRSDWADAAAMSNGSLPT